MRDICELWILNGAGVCLFNFTPETPLNPALFGGFIAAIEVIMKSLGTGEIKSLSLADHKLVFTRDVQNDLILIGRTEKNAKDNDVGKILNNIQQAFLVMYGKEAVVKWNGNTAFFEGFKDVIKRHFEEKIEKMQGIW